MQRITTPHPIGPLEGIYGGKADFSPGHRSGAAQQRDDKFVCYDGGYEETPYGTVHDAPTEPYQARQENGFQAPANWAVRSAEGHLAAVHLHGSGTYLGTRKQAEQWAKKINDRWGL
ncbi:hypothetical protein ACIG3E_33255 [Streptomyces sp. NPDC053474]|uniref:hypothetical protein n=1 Tax=Streptomyces sp. NPDC053474 TaxID=3365704 RepID=UPI0037D5D204